VGELPRGEPRWHPRPRGSGSHEASGAERRPKGTREAFPEIAWEDLKVSQEEGPVDMIIGRDNPEWMHIPMQEEPYEPFTLVWTGLSPHYLIRENKRIYGVA
jgi:hypothetical protein